MMQTFRTEGNYRSADRLSPAELRAAIASREILQSTALAFDTQRQLRFDLGGVKAVMPFGQCADGAESGTVRDIAVLTRVGRPTCFVIEGCLLYTSDAADGHCGADAGGPPHLLCDRRDGDRGKRPALLPAFPG